MKKRKKKPSAASTHKIERAHHKNEFFKRLKQFVALVSSPEVFSLIPEAELEKIYNLRFRVARIMPAEGEDIPSVVLKDSKHFLSEALKMQRVKVLPNDTFISMNDFFTVGLTLMTYLELLEKNTYAKAVELKEACAGFSKFMQWEMGLIDAVEELLKIMNYIAMIYSDISSRIYILKHEMRSVIDGRLIMCFCMEIYSRQAEKIQVHLEGHNRPASRVCWGYELPEPRLICAQIKVEELHLTNAVPGQMIDVYIQSHALIRLGERLDCVMPGALHFNISASLVNLKMQKEKNGHYLFEYTLFNIKVGYLRGDYWEGKIIIRTFLFLTYNGTPEGEKLEQNTGLLKEDRKYLAIDKLSTFIQSDISSNERVKEIFVKAGCGSLFEMNSDMFALPEDIKGKSTSELIAKYLGLEPPEQEVE